jgi:hypothetical protein
LPRKDKLRTRLARVPLATWSALVAAAVTAGGLLLFGPVKQPSKFYEIAAAIMPAFLIAVAVERSLLGSLGTKADFARVRRDETTDSYRARGFDAGVRNTIEFALLHRTTGAIPDDPDMLSIPVEPIDIAKAAAIGNWDDDPMFWSVFRDVLRDDFGLSEDPDCFDSAGGWIDPTDAFNSIRDSVLSRDAGPAVRLLAAHAALRQDRDFRGGTVGVQVVQTELKRLHDANHQKELRDVLGRITYRANLEYDRRVHQLVISLRTSIVVIMATEFLALIGVLSPGRPYSGLFVVTAAAVVASITSVAGGALADLSRARTRG